MRMTFLILINSVLLLGIVILIPTAVGQNVYSGSVSFIRFNNDGSFIFQLTQKNKPLVISRPDCEIKNMLLVKTHRTNVKHEKLNRMRNDIRELFLNQAAHNLQISVSVFSCDDGTGYPMVDNIMFGRQRK